ncbi:FG-GAP repeat domain-containing protein [Flavilitoribacter nigricans]|uniref:VCBS repeat-containing protein n=1 Tax=Flavilitoribacter nigricans (strain ATCC 23147 / DSM 23189 / NBRC 102662 / NCIMB 1420 / SS-2) TaxID=1122177 RepID=A0A2D0NBV1_FLAN2|nr:VCBS repeat-containing protein [Flavilitoribacter nigricans]PHN05992.1 hypothetical protein CRP01_13555 [Flavilitoribacter nigricans DSM 23189 = NBRC 102662]
MFRTIIWGCCCLFGLALSAQEWPRHTIDASSTGADGVKLADINADGLPDITTGWEEGALTRVYLHPGPAGVRSLWPAVTVGQTPAVEDAVFAPTNQRGRWVVFSCSEKNAEQIMLHFAPKRNWLDAEKWRQKVLPASDQRMMWMYAEPMEVDGRGGLDLVAGGKGHGAALGWFAAPRRTRNLKKWVWHPITPLGWLMGLFTRDMDGDGDLDLVITDRNGALRGCRWLENPGPGTAQTQAWNSHLIGGQSLEVMFMDIADLDGDGVEEIIVAERSEESVRVYTRHDTFGKNWEERIIALPDFTGRAKSVTAGDINRDGTPDLVISTNTNGAEKNGLIWLDGKHLDQAQPQDFKAISGAHNAKYDKVELLDIDLDGDLDVLICEENYGPDSGGLGVIWYENVLTEQ